MGRRTQWELQTLPDRAENRLQYGIVCKMRPELKSGGECKSLAEGGRRKRWTSGKKVRIKAAFLVSTSEKKDCVFLCGKDNHREVTPTYCSLRS